VAVAVHAHTLETHRCASFRRSSISALFSSSSFPNLIVDQPSFGVGTGSSTCRFRRTAHLAVFDDDDEDEDGADDDDDGGGTDDEATLLSVRLTCRNDTAVCVNHASSMLTKTTMWISCRSTTRRGTNIRARLRGNLRVQCRQQQQRQPALCVAVWCVEMTLVRDGRGRVLAHLLTSIHW